MNHAKYILTLSCPDQMGVVHTVSGFLFERGGNIIDSAQFNAEDSDRFFMRVNFEERRADVHIDQLKAEFAPIAERFQMEWELVDESVKPRLMIMVSKIGHCLNDLLFRHKSGNLPVDIAAIVSNHPDFYQLAASYNIPFHHFFTHFNFFTYQQIIVKILYKKSNKTPSSPYVSWQRGCLLIFSIKRYSVISASPA